MLDWLQFLLFFLGFACVWIFSFVTAERRMLKMHISFFESQRQDMIQKHRILQNDRDKSYKAFMQDLLNTPCITNEVKSMLQEQINFFDSNIL